MVIYGRGGHGVVVRDVLNALSRRYDDTWTFLAIGDNAARKRMADYLQETCYPILIHPSATVSDSATIGTGTIIMAGVVIQGCARIGKQCIVNTCASVDHHSVVGDFGHLAPGARLCGDVQIGDGVLVGVGVGIEPGVTISAWSTVKRIPYVIN